MRSSPTPQQPVSQQHFGFSRFFRLLPSNFLFLSSRPAPFRYVPIQNELPQRATRPRRLPATQRAHVTDLHPPHGEDRHLLPDGAQPGCPQHHLRGHRPPQPARLADHLPVWVLLSIPPALSLTMAINPQFHFGFLSFRLCRVCFPGFVSG